MAKTGFDELELKTPLAAAQIAGAGVQQLTFYLAGAQTTGAKKFAALMDRAGTILGVRARLDTPPTDASFIIDVNKNGTTIFTTQASRPTILTAENVSTTTAPQVTAFAAGDRITVDIDQIGSSDAGSDLSVTLSVKYALV